MKSLFRCPLTNNTEDLEIIEEINVAEVIKLYKIKRNLDLSNEFTTSSIYLIKNPKINFYFFYPFISGTSDFYNELTTTPKYVPKKEEYAFASKYINNIDKVLDVGCGWGWFKSYIPDSEYLGIEFSEPAIKECRKNNIHVTSTLIQDFVKTNQKFNVVTSFQVLEHIEDPLCFIKSMSDCTEDNGLIILSVPNLDSYRLVKENDYLNLPPHHISWWSKETFIFIAKELNLEIVDFNIEKMENSSMMIGIIAKMKFNKLFRRKKKQIRINIFDRVLNRFFNMLYRILPTIPKEFMPNGQSITVILRKK